MQYVYVGTVVKLTASRGESGFATGRKIGKDFPEFFIWIFFLYIYIVDMLHFEIPHTTAETENSVLEPRSHHTD